MKPVPHTRPGSLFGTSSPSLLNSAATAPAQSVRRPLLIWVAAAGLFAAAASPSVAQEYALLTSKPRPAEKSVESTKAFWKMTTQPGADSTLVGFYTPANKLMFAEMMPSDAVKLTKRTLRKLDETTDRLMEANGQPVAANTLSVALAGRAAPQAGQLQMGYYASQDGIHLHLMLDNPAREYVHIDLIDKDGRSVYQTTTRLDKPHFKFNLEEMPVGDYQLRVASKTQTFERNLSFSYPAPEPTVPILRIAIK